MANIEKKSCGVVNLVVDSGGFLKNAPIKDLGENVYTIEEVVNEIRDKATRERLQVIPYELHFKHPSPETIKLVTDFSKKTGDYSTLSAVDLKILALTYQLEKELVGEMHIRKEPVKKETCQAVNHIDPLPMGFFVEKKSNAKVDIDLHKETDDKESTGESNIGEVTDKFEDGVKIDSNPVEPPNNGDEADTTNDGEQGSGDDDDDDDDEQGSDDDDEEVEEGEVIDDCGWITPHNIHKFHEANPNQYLTPDNQVTVACLTTDFAMQNVLIQMGLKVVSVDGMLIKQARSYVLKCYGCFKVTKDMTRKYCHHCGNKTLQRVSYAVNEDGTAKYFVPRRKVTTRGLRYSIPLPKGGKYSQDPVLCEDQVGAQQRASRKTRAKLNAFDPDYVVGNSPFAPNDINSKSANLGFNKRRNNDGQRNQNENRKKQGKRK